MVIFPLKNDWLHRQDHMVLLRVLGIWCIKRPTCKLFMKDLCGLLGFEEGKCCSGN